MRVFLLPSWCPTEEEPLAGTFFFEQAQAMARARPHWTVAICQFDLARSRVPWRPWQLPGFARAWLRAPRVAHARAVSGLHEYRLFAPHLPRWPARRAWPATVAALAAQARPALQHFVQHHGRPDLIHALASYPGGGAAALLGKELGIPVGLTEHLGPFPPPTLRAPDGRPLPVVVRAYAGAERVSAVSHALADAVAKSGMARAVQVLPNFLPDEFGAHCALRVRGAQPFEWLNVGAPSTLKGTGTLLRALARSGGNARLRIVGDGPGMAAHQALAAQLGVADRVRWLGAVARQDMPGQYAQSDALVLASQGETFGVVLIEALACRRPVLATRCGGPQDIVRPDNGVLVAVDDVAAMAQAMEAMAASIDQYDGRHLRADFLQRFSATAVVGIVEQWYAQVRAVPVAQRQS